MVTSHLRCIQWTELHTLPKPCGFAAPPALLCAISSLGPQNIESTKTLSQNAHNLTPLALLPLQHIAVCHIDVVSTEYPITEAHSAKNPRPCFPDAIFAAHLG